MRHLWHSIPWAYIVASDALAPLTDVGYLRLNEDGADGCPTASFSLQQPCLILSVKAFLCEPCVLLATFLADRLAEGYLQELFRYFCVDPTVTVRLVHMIKLRASFLCLVKTVNQLLAERINLNGIVRFAPEDNSLLFCECQLVICHVQTSFLKNFCWLANGLAM